MSVCIFGFGMLRWLHSMATIEWPIETLPLFRFTQNSVNNGIVLPNGRHIGIESRNSLSSSDGNVKLLVQTEAKWRASFYINELNLFITIWKEYRQKDAATSRTMDKRIHLNQYWMIDYFNFFFAFAFSSSILMLKRAWNSHGFNGFRFSKRYETFLHRQSFYRMINR